MALRRLFALALIIASPCGAARVPDCTHTGAGTLFEVGPGQAYASIGAVPWEALNAGDTVRIHWRATPYREKNPAASPGHGLPAHHGVRRARAGRRAAGARWRKRHHARDDGLPRRGHRAARPDPRKLGRGRCLGLQAASPAHPGPAPPPRLPRICVQRQRRQHPDLLGQRRRHLRRARRARRGERRGAGRQRQRIFRRLGRFGGNALARRPHRVLRALRQRHRQRDQRPPPQPLHRGGGHDDPVQPLRPAARRLVRRQPQGPLHRHRGALQPHRRRRAQHRSGGSAGKLADGAGAARIPAQLRLRQPHRQRPGRTGQSGALRRRQRLLRQRPGRSRPRLLPQGHAAFFPQHRCRARRPVHALAQHPVRRFHQRRTRGRAQQPGVPARLDAGRGADEPVLDAPVRAARPGHELGLAHADPVARQHHATGRDFRPRERADQRRQRAGLRRRGGHGLQTRVQQRCGGRRHGPASRGDRAGAHRECAVPGPRRRPAAARRRRADPGAFEYDGGLFADGFEVFSP